MGLVSLLFGNPVLFFVVAVFLLYSIILHEVAHGWAAYLFGDNTAVRFGRLRLNPIAHLDPIGTAMLFLAGFGWAKPVPVDYDTLRRNRYALFFVALAGCAVNISIAIIAVFLLNTGFINNDSYLAAALAIVAKINIVLGAFNLLPIPPLDGSKIVMSFLPESAQDHFAKIEPYGFFILIFLLFTGILNPLVTFMQRVIYSLIARIAVFFPHIG